MYVCVLDVQEECGLVYVKSVTNQYKQDGACVTSLKYFTFKKIKYVWSEESDKFRSLWFVLCCVWSTDKCYVNLNLNSIMQIK